MAMLTGTLAPHPATAATGVSAEANLTWGTAPAEDRAGRVLAVVENGPVVYLAGEFTALLPPGARASDPAAVPRAFLGALDVGTGDITTFDARVNGPVRALALAPDGKRLYLGGTFRSVGGQPVRNLAAIDPNTGTLDPTFRPGELNSEVYTLAIAGDRLYAGGNFLAVTKPDGSVAPRPQVAAFDLASGDLLDWAPPANGGGEYYGQTGEKSDTGDGIVHDLAVSGDGKHLYAAGTFLDLGGHAGLVSIDTRSGKPTDWQPRTERPVFGLDIAPADGHTLFAAMGGAGGLLGVFDPGGDREPTWEVKTDGDNMAVEVSSDTAYLFGHYDYIVSAKSDCYQSCPGGPFRRHLAAFDAETGELQPWNPHASTSTGPYTGAIGQAHLYVGGEFTKVNGVPQPGFAQFPGRP